ncbi:MAG: Phenylalanine--tRNA ligase beta subunit [Syntrophaceae bacterium PtaB.Bin038]|nr:MAG: Phenylalanine--tRNA ligase beta subunit [Syntrophaceae bacterium PtaB.Bin038]
MKVSLKWLRDYVDLDITPQELADRLTMAGLEVDAVEEYTPAFTGVVTARILSMRRHPDADKLHLLEVTTGGEPIPIVCGAPNMKPGDVVALATVGAAIPGGYTIKSSKIRGEASEGMLCSEDELGIGPDASGLLILPPDTPLGENLIDVLDLRDTVLDIGVTPNRADCLSIVGIAREAAVLCGRKLRYPKISFTESAEDIRSLTSVEILDPDLCPRYTARMIRGVKILPSPKWMRERLEAVGLRAINNVVDVTNFVMMELGQPLHAFDFRFLEEGRIVVRRSREGEPFVSLDGKTRTLNAETLMICDGRKPVAIAGIMGGENSEVKDDTETVLLESAYFNPSTIRRGARFLGMGTDAAFRFERGIDPEGVVRALDRAAQLIADLSGGSVCKGHIDTYPKKVPIPGPIRLRMDRVEAILGTPVKASEATAIFKGLGMSVKKEGRGGLSVTPPTFRVDLWREIDLIEEIARIHGYDKIPVTVPAIPVPGDLHDRKREFESAVRSALNGQGFTEVLNYSFISAGSADVLGFPEGDGRRRFVRIANPLTEDQAVMRTTLLYGLLETMRRNVNAGSPDLKLFELGKIFIAVGEGELPRETDMIALLMTGSRYGENWHFQSLTADFYDVKGALENLAAALRVEGLRCEAAPDIPWLHPGRAARVYVGGREIGSFGELHPDVAGRMDLRGRAFVLEVEAGPLAGGAREAVRYREYSRFPSMVRDVAFLVGLETEAGRLIALAAAAGEELLEKVDVFDVYSGRGIPEGMKSLGLRFTYRSASKTLTDEETGQAHGRIVKKIVETTGARIRGEG